MKELTALCYLSDTQEFEQAFSNFVVHLSSDLDTMDFGHYLKDHYLPRFEHFAPCWRKDYNITTNMYLEAFHKNLKHKELGRKEGDITYV